MNAWIEEYKVIEACANQGTKELERLVNEAIADGWQPYGPMTASLFNDLYYAQPMVKYKAD